MSRSAELARQIRDTAGSAPPSYGVMLGPGLGHLESAASGVTLPCPMEPSAPFPSRYGQRITVGSIEGQRIAMFAGRPDPGPGQTASLALPLQVLGELGCDRLIIAAPAASLSRDMAGGSLMLVGDHLTLGPDPLVGHVPDGFVPMEDAYDPGICADLRAAASGEACPLPQGVVCWRPGVAGWTPAEARAAAMIGADAISWSIVPHVILARSMGLRCAALATITHVTAGPTAERTTDDLLRQRTPQGAARLALLLRRFLRD